MDKILAPFVKGRIEAVVRVPGSKSITQRALICASLATGDSKLIGALKSEDIELSSNALRELGVNILEQGDSNLDIQGVGCKVRQGPKEIFLGNNGTGMRFITAVCGLGEGEYILDGTKRMQERPIEPLLEALRGWGVKAESLKATGCPPVKIETSGISGGKTYIDASKSSQFLSALMLIAPCAQRPCEIEILKGLVSRPYIEITKKVMAAFFVDVTEDKNIFFIPNQGYKGTDYEIEGDASSASYFWAAAAITGGSIEVENVPTSSMQGDAKFVEILKEMGCRVEKGHKGVRVNGPLDGELKSIDIDMSKWPDMVPTLAAVAVFADGVTRIKNVHHLRIKETDRLSAVANELKKLGVNVKEFEDGLEIEGKRDLTPELIDTYDDHRIAMSFAVIGLRCKGLYIKDPACVRKSFPNFWQKWQEMLS